MFASEVVVGAFSHARLVIVLTLVLTRHGVTARSVPEQHLGQKMDVPLSSDGLRQAHALARRLHDVGFDRIVTSPLVRARETAEIVAIGRPVIGDARLAEMDYGEWEGHTYPEVRALHPGFRGKWESDPATLRCPGGESGNDVARRVGAFLRDILDPGSRLGRPPEVGTTAGGEEDGRRILVVAHSTVDRILCCTALGIPIRDFRRRFAIEPTSVTVLRWHDGADPDAGELILLNDVTHLRHRGEIPWG
jgi:probable phosphoglycerate mutase